jgi:hypothetical protein
MPDSVDTLTEDGAGAGERTPLLILDGCSGSLEGLLTLARSRRIELAKILVLDLVDQLAAAMRDAPAATPVGQKGDWLVMASWLVQLRSLLLLPADAPAHQLATDAADRLRKRLSGPAEIQALAAWLDDRPQLGRDAFVRGKRSRQSGTGGTAGLTGRAARVARPRMNRNGSGVAPPARASSAARPRGADSRRDDAFALDPTCRCSHNRFGTDGNPGLLRRWPPTSGPRCRGGAKQCSLVTGRALHGASLTDARGTSKAASGRPLPPARCPRPWEIGGR